MQLFYINLLLKIDSSVFEFCFSLAKINDFIDYCLKGFKELFENNFILEKPTNKENIILSLKI